jgi:bifunctional enzyme CysN/CysC
MATGASNSDLAVVLVDARKGLSPQTRRHALIVSLLGVKHVVLAVNKMDLVDYDASAFDAIVADFRLFAENLDFAAIAPIPLSARFGDNVSAPSDRMPWYGGPTLLAHLESVDVEVDLAEKPMRMPIQWVNRPDLDFRGFAGMIVSGRLRAGDEIVVAPSGRQTRVARIVTMDGDVDGAEAMDSVTLVLADEVDAARGDVLCHPMERPEVADQFAAHLIWMDEDDLLPGRSYLLKINGRTLPATVTEIKHRLDVETLAKAAAKTLSLNDVGFCNLALSTPLPIESYAENRATGAFILIDRRTNATAAAGMISFVLRRATNVHVQELTVSKKERSQLKHQKPTILWFTGLSGSGKSTVANLVEARLVALQAHTILLDGDNVRHGLNKDLGFTDADRVENIRRIGEVAKLMLDAGLIVLCAFISPFEGERRMVREMVEEGEFIEVFIDTPLEICIRRDPKGLYKRALAGQIKNFTGIDQAYERPETPELHFSAANQPASAMADRIMLFLEDAAVLAKG